MQHSQSCVTPRLSTLICTIRMGPRLVPLDGWGSKPSKWTYFGVAPTWSRSRYDRGWGINCVHLSTAAADSGISP